MAEQLGIAIPTLRSYENGNRTLPPPLAIKIERLFGIGRAELLPELFEGYKAAEPAADPREAAA
jgi:transcriptional regulator with XRE-family HTH domain